MIDMDLLDKQMAEMKKSIEQIDRRKAKADALADSIAALVQSSYKNKDELDYMLHIELPESLGDKLMPMFAYDGIVKVNNPLIERMFDGYIINHIAPKIKKNIDTIWEKQKEDVCSYGDIDFSFKKILDNDEVRVGFIEDHVTMSNRNLFLLVEDKTAELLHIRTIWPRANLKSFPNKLSLKYYRDNDFKMEYGDIRDDGYVLTFSTRCGSFNFSLTTRCIYYCVELEHVSDYLLDCMVDELEKQDENKDS